MLQNIPVNIIYLMGISFLLGGFTVLLMLILMDLARHLRSKNDENGEQ